MIHSGPSRPSLGYQIYIGVILTFSFDGGIWVFKGYLSRIMKEQPQSSEYSVIKINGTLIRASFGRLQTPFKVLCENWAISLVSIAKTCKTLWNRVDAWGQVVRGTELWASSFATVFTIKIVRSTQSGISLRAISQISKVQSILAVSIIIDIPRALHPVSKYLHIHGVYTANPRVRIH